VVWLHNVRFMFTASCHYLVKLFQLWETPLPRMSHMMISSVSSRQHWILRQPKQSASPVTVERYDYDRMSSTSWTIIRHCLTQLWWNVSSAQQARYFATVGANCVKSDMMFSYWRTAVSVNKWKDVKCSSQDWLCESLQSTEYFVTD